MKLKKESIGARTYIAAVDATVTVNEESAGLLLKYGMVQFFENVANTEEKDTTVTEVKVSEDDSKLTLPELREKYPNVKARSKGDFLKKLKG